VGLKVLKTPLRGQSPPIGLKNRFTEHWNEQLLADKPLTGNFNLISFFKAFNIMPI
jgi:hypothetical protein